MGARGGENKRRGQQRRGAEMIRQKCSRMDGREGKRRRMKDRRGGERKTDDRREEMREK